MFYDGISCFPLKWSLYGRVFSSTWPLPEPGCVADVTSSLSLNPISYTSIRCTDHTLPPSRAKWVKARRRSSNGLSSTQSDCRWTLWRRRTSRKRRTATIAALLRSFWRKYDTFISIQALDISMTLIFLSCISINKSLAAFRDSWGQLARLACLLCTSCYSYKLQFRRC